MRPTPCDVSEQIRLFVATYRNQSPAHVFEVVLPDCPVVLLVDEQRMSGVFDNLLSNAVKYSPKGGAIRVTCRLTDDGCLFTVEDQGIGMTPQQVRLVFDKFYRADHSNTAMPGMGVGMTAVKHVIEAQGGKVWVESAVGKGTTGTFTQPIAGAATLEGGDTVEKNTRSG
jgi:two-component system phosphate regulon sensor histidine kinase PhoR